MTHSLILTLVAALFELALSYPDWLYARIGHPVGAIAAVIVWLEARLNRTGCSAGVLRSLGLVTVVILMALSYGIGEALQAGLARLPGGLVATALLASSLLAHRSLDAHVAAVARGLRQDLGEGRLAVSRIVGRDPERLDEAGVARAAIESLAENFSDGVVAPLLWMAILGLPGALTYKAINTADSMIGHLNARYRWFGWAAARLDDLVNLPASRAAAVWIVAAAACTPGASAKAAIAAVWRDAGRHRSPNAGWPEAAMAGGLGLSLGGARFYGGVLVDDAAMGDGNRNAGADDIDRALRLYRRAALIELLVLALATLAALSWA